MSFRTLLLTVLSIGLPVAPAAHAQQAQEQNAETISVPAVPDTSGKRPDLADAARRIVDQTNEFRKSEGRGPVEPDTELTAAARYFADFMARTDTYGHTADGNSPADRARKHGYDYCIVLENIANAFDSRGFETEQLAGQFVTGWKESPGHRKNMLDPDVTQTGVAVGRSEKTGYYYAVQMFGRPKSAAIEFRVENRSDARIGYAIGDQTFDLRPRVIRTHTRCRPPELRFTWPDGQSTTVKPATGDRLVVTRNGDGFAVGKK